MKKRNSPIISIITPCLNRAKYIEDAVESVLKQNYPYFEHIIIDGGSTDGTLDILARYPHLRVVSEPDRGLYDALNKGIQVARGDIIGWLNSDDLYTDGVFYDVARKATEFPSVEIITGDSDLFVGSPDSNHVIRRNKFYSCRELTEGRLAGVISLNGCFFKRDLFEKIGLFNANYCLTADHDFLIRLSIHKPACSSLGRVSYHYRQHKGSLTWGKPRKGNAVIGCRELMTIASEYLSMPDTPSRIREYCRQLYFNSAINLFKSYMEARCFAKAMKAVREAQRQDPRFMRKFMGRAIIRGPIWLSRVLFQSIRAGLTKSSYGRSNA